MMETAPISETSVDNYFTRQYIPEDKSELETYACLIKLDFESNYIPYEPDKGAGLAQAV
jgi:hypothetical protein